MLTIRKEQMVVLGSHALAEFVERSARRLRATYAAATASQDDAVLRATIHDGIRRAAGFGIENEDDVATFLDWIMEYGAEFDIHPKCAWMRRILDDRTLTGPRKVEEIETQAGFHVS